MKIKIEVEGRSLI